MSKKTVWTWDQVRAHGYFVANGYVYDPKDIYDRHPGGQRCLDNNRGTDCTYHYKMHQDVGKASWSKCLVGVLERTHKKV